MSSRSSVQMVSKMQEKIVELSKWCLLKRLLLFTRDLISLVSYVFRAHGGIPISLAACSQPVHAPGCLPVEI